MFFKIMLELLKRGRELSSLMHYCVIFACLTWVTSATIMGDECDWTGSGLTTSIEDRGVTPVYLRCTAGKVRWLYPRGALRVLLRLPSQDREFRACIKVHPDKQKHLAARLFLEGPRSLLTLYSHDDGGHQAVRCFQSRNGQAALYIEASISDRDMDKRVTEIEYDLQPLQRGVRAYDPAEECRPCSVDELTHAFCTSDLVTRGIIHGIENRDELEVSQLAVKVTKLIRHTTEDAYLDDIEEEENIINNPYVDNKYSKEVILNVAQHCGVKHGTGEFVFMAKRKLGDLTLRCAPRLEDWAMLVNDLSLESHCVLRS